MTCTVCPNCGLDLERFTPVHRGDLDIEPHEVRWRGRIVPISLTCRLILSAIVRADGVPVRRAALIEAAGSETDGTSNLVSVYISRIRSAFKTIDLRFDHLETVHSQGVRWVD